MAQLEASTDCEAAYTAIPQDAILDLLDPESPLDRRQQALEHYTRLAGMTACPEFGYTLAQLYRHGPDMPGNLVERDVERAEPLIRAMAEAGYLPAYADLAEMEMRHESYRKAMQWTQVYLHFVRTVEQPLRAADSAQFHRSAYNGHLLARAEVVWRWQKPALARKYVREDLNAYLAGDGKGVSRRIRERMEGVHARVSAQDGPDLRMVSDIGDCSLFQRDRIGAATASWIAEVLPSGALGRVVLENFVPSPGAADRLLRECVVRYRFAPFDGEQSRTVRLSVMYGSTEGASYRR